MLGRVVGRVSFVVVVAGTIACSSSTDSSPSQGGDVAATGGASASAGNGGTPAGNGGTTPASSGGNTASTGGNSSSTGGAPTSSGGAPGTRNVFVNTLKVQSGPLCLPLVLKPKPDGSLPCTLI